MGKKRAAAASAEVQNVPQQAADAGKPGRKKAADKKPAAPPAQPFGDVLPNAAEQGSPADKTWKPKGDPLADIATLESQERYLYRIMERAKAEKNLAKAQAGLLMTQAEETSVTDGFAVEDKRDLHVKAETASARALKYEREYKRARQGWQSVKDTLHRYLTEPDPPLFSAKQTKKSRSEAA